MMKVKKLSFKFFLMQVIVLLSGPLLAYSCQDILRTTPHHHLSFEHTPLLTEELFTRTASLGTEKQNRQLSITLFENEEDDELNSYKKHLENGHPASVFFAQTPGLFLSDSETILSFYRYFSSVSRGRYLLLQVFRI